MAVARVAELSTSHSWQIPPSMPVRIGSKVRSRQEQRQGWGGPCMETLLFVAILVVAETTRQWPCVEGRIATQI